MSFVKSTIVRSVRIGAALGTVVAPDLSARWLERLFLTPTRRPVPARERAWLDGATPSRVSLDARRELAVWSWGEGPVALLVHGWSGRGSQLGAWVRPLVERGYRVVAFDAPAHGASDGRRTGLPEVARAVRRVAEAVGPVDVVVAHSMGAAATTIALADGLSARRAVFVGPPENPGVYLYGVASYLGFGDDVAHRARSRIEQRFSAPFDRVRGTTLAPDLETSLLVIHDQDDSEVQCAEGERLVAAWPGAELRTTRGLGHHRILRDSDVVRAGVDFLVEDEAAMDGRAAG